MHDMSQVNLTFQDSPLHRYLKEVDFLVEATPVPQTQPKKLIGGLISFFQHFFHGFRFISWLSTSDYIPAVCQHYARRLIDTSLISPDDLSIIKSLAPSLIYNPLSTVYSVRKAAFWGVLTISGISSFTMWNLRRFSSLRRRLLFLGLSPAISILAWKLLSIGQLLRHQRNCKAVEVCVKSLDTTSLTISRAIRFIQEIELVSRGYEISTRHVPPIVRLEALSHRRKCMPLRHAIWKAIRRCIQVLRSATQELLEKFPLGESADYHGYYLACSSSEPQGSLFTIPS